MLWGGLPEVVLTTSEQKSLLYLSNYLQTYLEKDVRAILEITNLNIYQQLIEIIATQTGSIREDQKILKSQVVVNLRYLPAIRYMLCVG